MKLKILGSAGDGGFPQWNCACSHCAGLRDGTLKGQARSQTQIAFSPIEGVWFLVGASPDLRTQIVGTPELAPHGEGGSPIAGVFLLAGDLASSMGLLHLRDRQSFFLFATPAVQRLLKSENWVSKVLQGGNPPVQWQMLSSRGRIGCHLSQNAGDPPTFYYGSVPTGGDYPEFAAEEFRRNAAPDEANVGLWLEQDDKKVFIAPRISGSTSLWTKAAAGSNVTLIDGTYWSDQEPVESGQDTRTARALGHLPLSGPQGLLQQFPAEAQGRKILIHMNSTNPILDEESDEHRAVVEAGFEIAYDGLTIEL